MTAPDLREVAYNALEDLPLSYEFVSMRYAGGKTETVTVGDIKQGLDDGRVTPDAVLRALWSKGMFRPTVHELGGVQ